MVCVLVDAPGASAKQPRFVGGVASMSGTSSGDDTLVESAPAGAQLQPRKLGKSAAVRVQAAPHARDWAAGQSAGTTSANSDDPSMAGDCSCAQTWESPWLHSNKGLLRTCVHRRCMQLSVPGDTFSGSEMQSCTDDATSPPPRVSRRNYLSRCAGAPMNPQRSINPTQAVCASDAPAAPC